MNSRVSLIVSEVGSSMDLKLDQLLVDSSLNFWSIFYPCTSFSRTNHEFKVLWMAWYPNPFIWSLRRWLVQTTYLPLLGVLASVTFIDSWEFHCPRFIAHARDALPTPQSSCLSWYSRDGRKRPDGGGGGNENMKNELGRGQDFSISFLLLLILLEGAMRKTQEVGTGVYHWKCWGMNGQWRLYEECEGHKGYLLPCQQVNSVSV